MITTAGKNVIKRVFSGQLPRVANLLVVGSGAFDATVTIDDTALTRESYRAAITSISADLLNNRIVFKATIPAGAVYQIGEVGLIQGDSTTYKSVDLPLFGNGSSQWSGGTLSSVNARNHASAVVFSLAASANATPTISNLAIDFSGYSDLSNIYVSYLTTTTNLQTFKIRFLTSTGNYFEYTVTPVATANSYTVAKLVKSAATVTGSPNWATITQVQLVLAAKSAGGVDLHLDGLMIVSSADTSSILVAKNILAVPTVIDAAIDTDIEYSLVISV